MVTLVSISKNNELPDYFNLVVYNRWGRKVYESLEVGSYWDGTHYKSGEDCPDGVYYSFCKCAISKGQIEGKRAMLPSIADALYQNKRK